MSGVVSVMVAQMVACFMWLAVEGLDVEQWRTRVP